VLEAVGAAGSGFRVSLGAGSSAQQVDALLDVLPDVVSELQEVERVSEAALARFRPPGP
jgi:cysteine sulfinate desulfinase/cysteine desulfurase-like protein